MKTKIYIKNQEECLVCPVCGEEVKLVRAPQVVLPHYSNVKHEYSGGEDVAGTISCACTTFKPGELDRKQSVHHLRLVNDVTDFYDETSNEEFISAYEEADLDNLTDVENLHNLISEILEDEHNNKFVFVRFSISDTGFTEYVYPKEADEDVTLEELTVRHNVCGTSEEIKFLSSIGFEALASNIDAVILDGEMNLGDKVVAVDEITPKDLHVATDVCGDLLA